MGKKANIYLVIVLLTILLLMLLQFNKPKEINWFPSYVAQHKIPYGTYVLNELMGNLFNNIQQVNHTAFEFLSNNSEAAGTYFMVNDNIEFGDTDLDALLEWATEGNTLFIASKSFEHQLLDTLGLKTSGLFAGFSEDQKQLHQLVNPSLNPDARYVFEKDSYANFFKTIDTLNTKVIGLVHNSEDSVAVDKVHFDVIHKKFGEGEIFLSTFPNAFTNYFILKDNNREYTAGLLSYLDSSSTIYMDNNYKSGKTFYTSPMYIFLNTKEFKWAYYLSLIGVLIYVIFEGKRKQRAIPIVTPLKNQTLAFTRTIADMYYEKGQQKAISEHKIEHFFEYIRARFYLSTIDRNAEFYKNLAARSSHSVDEINSIFNLINKLKAKAAISDEELKNLNTIVEKFKHKADGK